MDQHTLNSHYRRLAGRYDQSFSAGSSTSSTGYSFSGEAGARTIIDMMNIKKEDRVVDLGAGTCSTAGSETGRLLSSYIIIARLYYLHGAAGAASDLCGSCQGNVGYCHQE